MRAASEGWRLLPARRSRRPLPLTCVVGRAGCSRTPACSATSGIMVIHCSPNRRRTPHCHSRKTTRSMRQTGENSQQPVAQAFACAKIVLLPPAVRGDIRAVTSMRRAHAKPVPRSARQIKPSITLPATVCPATLTIGARAAARPLQPPSAQRQRRPLPPGLAASRRHSARAIPEYLSPPSSRLFRGARRGLDRRASPHHKPIFRVARRSKGDSSCLVPYVPHRH